MKKPLDGETRQKVTVPAAADSISRLTGFVSSYARDMTFEDKRVGEIALALEEALENIIRFACPRGDEKITITCDVHEMGALLIDIVDSGVPFNMLVVSTFPETADGFSSPDQMPSTRVMKRVVKDIEYRRDGDNKTNILVWVVSK